MKQRLLSGLLAVVLVLGLAPAALAAAPTEDEAAQALAPLFTALPQVPEGSVTFQDLLDASPELRHAVQLLADYGILNGDGLGNFNPDATITRAEICAMLDRILLYFFDTTPADDATDRGDESNATDASNKEDRPNAGTDASEEGVGANR